MTLLIKKIVNKLIDLAIAILQLTQKGCRLIDLFIDHLMMKSRAVKHGDIELVFSTPNSLNLYRANTFSTKEPETLRWIDGIRSNSILWDVGANVGIYSCYAAKKCNCRVYAFEPSVFNLEILARNLALNNLSKKVTIVPLPLNERLEESQMKMTNTTWGGALSTFSKNYGHDGNAINGVFEYSIIGISMLDAVNLLGIPKPDYIKIDVDGIEHLILKGGIEIIKSVKELLVEINDQFREQATEATSFLNSAGFELIEKSHADCFDSYTSAAKYTYNQIWINKKL